MPDLAASFCAGFPRVEGRPLTDEERGVLTRALRQRRRRAWSWLVAMVVGWAGVSALVGLAPKMPGSGTVFPMLIIAAILATPILIVLARDDFRLARAMRKGLTSGRVHRFAGVLNPTVAVYDATATRLLAKKLLRLDTDGEQSIEILADAGLVWRVNDVRTRRWLAATLSEVAPTPDFAATAAEWVQPFTSPEGETTWWNQRALTEEEHGELRKHIASIFRPAPIWVIFNVYIIAGLVAGAWRTEPFPFFIWLAFAVWMDFRVARTIPHVLVLRRDLRVSAVAIVRAEAKGETGEERGPGAAELTAATEFLPYSRLIWSHDGEPAAWRRSRRG
jgi:hypothetical protein